MIPNTASIAYPVPFCLLCFGWKGGKSVTSDHLPPTDFHLKMHVATETRRYDNRTHDR